MMKHKKLKDCPGCIPVTRLEGKMDALLFVQDVDPIKAVSRNPGHMDRDYMTIHLRGKNAMGFLKWFIGTLLSVGAVTGILNLLGVF